jgi:hypothetical protein
VRVRYEVEEVRPGTLGELLASVGSGRTTVSPALGGV